MEIARFRNLENVWTSHQKPVAYGWPDPSKLSLSYQGPTRRVDANAVHRFIFYGEGDLL